MHRILIASLALTAPAMAETPGAALFLRGEGAQVVIGAGDGAVRLPAARFACAGCHGADGAGRAEGGTDFPDIRWSHLSERYDDAALLTALQDGLTPEGRQLGTAMPRYEAPQQTLTSLLAYLKGLEAAQTAISPDTIRIRAADNDDLNAGFAAAAQQFNEDGGAFGRRLVLVPEGSEIGLEDLAAMIGPEIDKACLDASLNALRGAGVTHFRLMGADGAEAAYRARSIGLTLDEGATDILTVERPVPGKGPEGLHYYGCLDVLGPVVQELVAQGDHVTLAVPDVEGFAWALSAGRDWHAMQGYTLGRIIGRAARAAGRRMTGTYLSETAKTQPIAVETVSFPP